MKLRTSMALLVALLCFSVSSFAQPNTTFSHEEASQSVRDLSGMNWKMKMMRPDAGVKVGLPQIPPEDIETLVWNSAKVPGDVYTDLWRAGAIEDPYFGRNSIKAQWVQHYEWWYSLQFNYQQPIKDEVIEIVFEGVDYSCEVWLV